MKLAIINSKNTSMGQTSLPIQFSEEIRPDLIKRAVLSLQSRARQAYGAKPRAGLDFSATLSRRRRHYRGSYGLGISRVPRKIMSRSGTRFNWVGAVMPGTVGGRRAHPPKAWKIFDKLINKTENRKAIRSAMAASIKSELVKERGHVVPKEYPFLIGDDFAMIARTSVMITALEKIGLTEDLARAKPTKVRAGKGKMRGRKTRRATSALLVFDQDCNGLQAANNIPGVTAITVEQLNAEFLAPGASPARLTLYSQSAIEKIDKERWFMQIRPKPVVEEKKPVEKKVAKRIVKKTKAVKTTKTVTKAHKAEGLSKAKPEAAIEIAEVKKDE